ncbi:MAG: hypothetical protein U0359_03730 [Byssovorax sp.]
MADLFGLTMSVGSVVACQEQAALALEAPHAEVRLRQARSSTPTRRGGERLGRVRGCGPRDLVRDGVLVQARRSTDAARALLGDTWCLDRRWGAYGFWPDLARRLC